MPVQTITIPARRCGKSAALGTAKRKISFDKALRLVVPRLTRRQREFIASVAGFREADIFDVAMIERLEAPAWDLKGLVRWEDTTWKRHMGRKRQMSSSYRLTEYGKLYVTSAANLIALSGSDKAKGERAQKVGATK